MLCKINKDLRKKVRVWEWKRQSTVLRASVGKSLVFDPSLEGQAALK